MFTSLTMNEGGGIVVLVSLPRSRGFDVASGDARRQRKARENGVR